MPVRSLALICPIVLRGCVSRHQYCIVKLEVIIGVPYRLGCGVLRGRQTRVPSENGGQSATLRTQGAGDMLWGGARLAAVLAAYWLASVSVLVYALLRVEAQARLDALFGIYAQVCVTHTLLYPPPSGRHPVITISLCVMMVQHAHVMASI